MKLSLAWIFDHLTAPLQSIDIPDLLKQLNQKTVEIDAVTNLSLDKNVFGLISFDGTAYTAIHQKKQLSITMPERKDLQKNGWYFIVFHSAWDWATMKDFGSSKDTLLPQIFLQAQDPSVIIDSLEWQDHIIEISNSSITHRPDLWCHRGFAREIGAIYGIPLKPLELVSPKIIKYEQSPVSPSLAFPFTINIKTPACGRFIAAAAQTTVKPSLPFVTSRLSRIDLRPINALVDGTNIVMADIGHPMHIFDADQIEGKTITVTQQITSPLTLLDGQTVEIQPEDIVLHDIGKPLSLAGVMGGANSGIADQTKNILIEAAAFNSSTIRKTAAYHKKRTEASVRFEKNLDSNQALIAVQRFLLYAQQYKLIARVPDIIVDCGTAVQQCSITINHQEIETMLGITIDYRFIEKSLAALECDITRTDDQYIVTIPSFRQDLTIKEDIVEEIGRLYGYDTIKPVAPAIKTVACVNHQRLLLGNIRNILAFGIGMHECNTYAFFDENFIEQIGWPQEDYSANIKMPVSQNWQRLVTSLIPGLLKAVVENSPQHDSCRFFEIGTVWQSSQTKKTITETLTLTFILGQDSIDFYTGKSIVNLIMQLYGITAEWQQCTIQNCPVWLMPFQSAALLVEKTIVGYAGMLNHTLHKALGKDVPKQLFAAEINLDLVATCTKKSKIITMPSKYQPVTRDVTFWVPKTCLAQSIVECIHHADPHVTTVKQISHLEKEEWPDHRALTVRCTIGSYEKTFTKQEIDAIMQTVIDSTHTLGITVR